MFALAQVIRQTRIAKRISQAELAVKAGVGVATLQNIEAGRANPSYSTILALLKILNVEIEFKSKTRNKSADLSLLGCPLLSNRNSETLPNRKEVIQELRLLDPSLQKGRQKMAVAAWLNAIQSHFPSVWEEAPMATRAWLQNQRISPKLRRIAISKLAEFM